MNRRYLFYGALIAAGLVCGGQFLRGCMDLPETIFTGRSHPDPPLDDFARGRLGIVQPTYYRADLYVAYRNLAGVGFTAGEISALWPWKPTNQPPAGSPGNKDWVQSWLDARNKIPGVATKQDMGWNWLGPYRLVSQNSYSFPTYFNCGEDAFRNAIQTLQARAERFGADNEFVRGWVAAQDDVFANCQQGETIPAPASANAPALIQADRAYQAAAAYFYAGNFDRAQQVFGEIAKDRASPWSGFAPYLVARCLIRRATVGHEDGKPDIALLTQAEQQLRSVVANPDLKESHGAAQKLLGYVEVRLHPRQRALELATALMKKDSAEALSQDLRDYTFLLDKLLDQQAMDTVHQTEHSASADLKEVRRQDDLTDWILTFQLEGPEALGHSLEKWEKTRSVPWLMATLAKIPADNPKVPELIAAAEKIPAASPGHVWATFNITRLMAQSGERAEARSKLDRFLTENRSQIPRSSFNLFLALATELSQSLEEFLKDSQRIPVEGGTSFGFGGNEPEAGPRFDLDSASVLNQVMPLAVLEQVAKNESLNLDLRRQIAAAAWARAVLYNDEAAALELVPVLEQVLPDTKEYLEAYRSAPSPEARRFAAAYFLLKFPGAQPFITGIIRSTPWNRIDDLHENWWSKGGLCGLNWEVYNYSPTEQPGDAGLGFRQVDLGHTLRMVYPDGKVPPPEFLTSAQLDRARRELAKLVSLPSAPKFLTEKTLTWARGHADDPRVPEALHRAVMSARYGCSEPEVSKFSKQAFELLHLRYPNDPWTRRTRYWYGSPSR